ncbi:hypothetical protein JX265_012874 [Neoarthrinium moseri]|uniref:Uncharacterized protein n=1 Tax=Neoarthrinium moseri TaxID=1658444 RepID=A0A9Q0AJB2_9PEZI|nr:uncharacterized protein JN550_009742 [Neoarthrinium moseri]KAI1840997.1 hypothetical protein JX266_012778 [Neoarthrinium moseri]KAI1852985.1 hypothetical protein JX265_012874 [Neoarthrinium moseri]KAI1863216.1 hypothetical protein JN550_009742 [Neoarthrinium moseri]
MPQPCGGCRTCSSCQEQQFTTCLQRLTALLRTNPEQFPRIQYARRRLRLVPPIARLNVLRTAHHNLQRLTGDRRTGERIVRFMDRAIDVTLAQPNRQPNGHPNGQPTGTQARVPQALRQLLGRLEGEIATRLILDMTYEFVRQQSMPFTGGGPPNVRPRTQNAAVEGSRQPNPHPASANMADSAGQRPICNCLLAGQSVAPNSVTYTRSQPNNQLLSPNSVLSYNQFSEHFHVLPNCSTSRRLAISLEIESGSVAPGFRPYSMDLTLAPSSNPRDADSSAPDLLQSLVLRNASLRMPKGRVPPICPAHDQPLILPEPLEPHTIIGPFRINPFNPRRFFGLTGEPDCILQGNSVVWVKAPAWWWPGYPDALPWRGYPDRLPWPDYPSNTPPRLLFEGASDEDGDQRFHNNTAEDLDEPVFTYTRTATAFKIPG